MNNYNVVIGVEIHLELLTKTKMFSAAPISYGQKPNISVDEVVLAYPGSMPQVNKKAVELAIKASHLLGMNIDQILKFDRKHYWYHDLPKGFQITQNTNPIGSKGSLEIDGKIITLTRAHLEEDTAKTLRKNKKLFIDYNRCGNPLLEIVTGPDFENSNQVVEYVNTVREIMFYNSISNSKMEEGSLRCDINISLNKTGKPFGTKVEIKNINSTANIIKAVDFEIKRQSEKLESGENITQETRRFDEESQKTKSMRSKETLSDYKYIRESNISDIYIDNEFVKNAINSIEINTIDFKKRLLEENFTKKQTNEIIGQFDLKDYIIYFSKNNSNTKQYFKILLNDLAPLLAKNKDNKLEPKKFSELISKIVNEGIPSWVYKKVLKDMIINNIDINEAIEKNKIGFIKDKKIISEIIKPLITQELKETYKNRPERVKKQLMGQIMKKTKGKADPVISVEIIKTLLK